MFATLLEFLDFLWKDVQNERIVVVMDLTVYVTCWTCWTLPDNTAIGPLFLQLWRPILVSFS